MFRKQRLTIWKMIGYAVLIGLLFRGVNMLSDYALEVKDDISIWVENTVTEAFQPFNDLDSLLNADIKD